MKHYKKKIAHRLIVGFIALTTLSSLITGAIYIQIFYRIHVNTKIDTMLSYAYQLGALYKDSSLPDTLELYDNLLNLRVWIIPKDGAPLISHRHERASNTSSCHQTASTREHQKCQIKSYDQSFMDTVLSGHEIVSPYNNNFYYGHTLSVVVPIQENGSVIGGILLHAPLDTVYAPIFKAILFLGISIILSALLIFILARKYALDFTSSIRQMQHTAFRLMKGNYTVQTGINREDEIGGLALALDTLALQLDEASQESEKLEQVRRNFIANVSHEFRTPLTIIKGNAEALIDQTSTSQEEAYENILKETLILERLITDLLDLSRLQQGQIDLHLEQLYLPDVIQDALRSIRQVAHYKKIVVQAELMPIPTPIYSDYLRLRQIFIILLDNAVKYTPEGGLIHIKLLEDTCPILTISDNGIGISAHELPFIWDRFYKVDKSRKASCTSSGLGLAIAKNLLDLLIIQVETVSELGKGTTFTLTFPPTQAKE